MNQDKIEEVKVREKIADIFYYRECDRPGAVRNLETGLSKFERQVLYKEQIDQICQLFEPKPDESRLQHARVYIVGGKEMDGLLDKRDAQYYYILGYAQPKEGYGHRASGRLRLCEAQRDLTASIKDAEYQERIESIRQELMGIDCMGDISDIRKAITSLVYSLKKQEEMGD